VGCRRDAAGDEYGDAEEDQYAASLAEMERDLTVERTRAGLEVARLLGRKGGGKRQMTDSKIESAKKLLATGVAPRDVANNLGVSVPTLYGSIPSAQEWRKERHEFPAKGFAKLAEARAWAAGFVHWRNVDHRHSGIRYVTRRSVTWATMRRFWPPDMSSISA